MTQTYSNILDEYKRLVPTDRRIKQRGRISTAILTREIKRIKRIRKVNKRSAGTLRQINRQQAAKTRNFFRTNVLSEIKKPIYHITPNITIYIQRYTKGIIENIDTIISPTIEYEGQLTGGKNQIFKIIKNYINQIEVASGHIRIIMDGENPEFTFARNGIFHNSRYKSLQRETEYDLNKITDTTTSTHDNLVLRDTEAPKLYSLGLDDSSIQTADGECILNGIIHRFAGDTHCINMTRASILTEMNNLSVIRSKISITIRHIIDWCLLKDISLYLLGVNNILIYKSISKKRNHTGLFIKVANNHAYLIDDIDLQQQIINNTQNNVQVYIDWKTANINHISGHLNEIYTHLTNETNTVLMITDITVNEEGCSKHCLNQLVIDIYEKENLAVENLSLDNHGNVIGFTYNDIWVFYNPKYLKICEILSVVKDIPSLTNKNLFQFRNQSIQSITRDILEQHNGKIPQSNLSVSVYNIFKLFIKGGYNETIDEIITNSDCKTLDIEKCHTAILYSRQHEWGIFKPFDEFKPYRGSIVEGAKYIITHNFNIGAIKLTTGIYDSEFIDNCIKNNLLTHDDIDSEIVPSSTLKADFFKEIIPLIYTLVPLHAKDLINLFIGSLGSHKNNISKCGWITIQLKNQFIKQNQSINQFLCYIEPVRHPG